MREDIKAYIDGELSPERMQEVRTALERDPELMQEYLAMKDITQKLQSLVRQPQVKGVEQTMQKVAPQRRFRLIEGFAVAAVLAICAFVFAPMFMKAREAAKSDVALMKIDKGTEGLAGLDEAAPFEEFDSKTKNVGGGAVTAAESAPMPAYGVQRGDSQGFTMPKTEKPVRKTSEITQAVPPTLRDTDAEIAANRLVIKDATLTVKVKDVDEAVSKSIQLAATYKGYVENSSVSQGTEKAPVSGNITIRVPQQNFEKALLEVEKFGDVTDRNSSGNDVTSEVTDIDARINTLKAEEESLRTLLRAATKMGDILDIKDRISAVRQQIESYASQQRVLTTLSALSTISLRFTTDEKEVAKVEQKVEDETWFEDTSAAALGILKGVGKFVAQVATFAFILIPVWVPVVLFLLWFRRRAFAPTPQG